MFCFIFLLVGSIVAGITSFSFLEGLDTTSPGGWRAAGDSENKANSAAGARLSLAIEYNVEYRIYQVFMVCLVYQLYQVYP